MQDTLSSETLPRLVRRVAQFLSLAIFGLALWGVHRSLHPYRYHDVLLGLRHIPPSRLPLAVALMIAAYTALTGAGPAHAGPPVSEVGTEVPSFTGEYGWQWPESPKAMGSTAGRVCFLVKIEGPLTNDGAEVRVVKSADGSTWYLLGGTADAAKYGILRARARCTPVSAYTEEYIWQQGQALKAMGGATGRACFLTGVSGKFRGNTEHVYASRLVGGWVLGGSSSSSGVQARARCVTVPSYSRAYSWSKGQAPVDMGPVLDGTNRVCFLTRVRGDFRFSVSELSLAYAYTIITSTDARWYLRGSNSSSALSVGARCI